MPDSKIHGGYYLKARQINNSLIAHAPPHVREIWDWLIKSAQHKPYKASNKIIGRGQVLTTYEEIANGLYWMIGFVKKTYKKHHIDFSMRWLRKEQMITTQKTTRGFIISICKYGYYQDPTNYDYDYQTEMITTPLRQGTDTINKNVKNDKKENIINNGAEILKNDGWNTKPNGKQIDLKLPPVKAGAVKELFTFSKRIEISLEQVETLWNIFKIQNFTGTKYYSSDNDVFTHFINWSNKPSINIKTIEYGTHKQSFAAGRDNPNGDKP